MADIRCGKHGILIEQGPRGDIVHIPRKDPCDSGEFDVTSYDVDRLVVTGFLLGSADDRGPWAPAGGHPV